MYMVGSVIFIAHFGHNPFSPYKVEIPFLFSAICSNKEDPKDYPMTRFMFDNKSREKLKYLRYNILTFNVSPGRSYPGGETNWLLDLILIRKRYRFQCNV